MKSGDMTKKYVIWRCDLVMNRWGGRWPGGRGEPPASMDLWWLKGKDKEDKRIKGNIISFFLKIY